jgi:hypothetical protein
MKPESSDMSAPVTRGELRIELAELEQKLEKKLEKYATKVDLELWGGALFERLLVMEERLEQRLSAQMARHSNALFERLESLVSVVDEKYQDLPARVTRLEGRVFKRSRGR